MPRAERLRAGASAPPLSAFTARERALIARLRTPLAVQRYLNHLPYNREPDGHETQRGFRGVIRHHEAHCLEAALFAAVVLEQHGYPPLVLSFESVDLLDHVLYVYRASTGWGSVARSRDPGLHGRNPVFATPRALAQSYIDAYVDLTGRVKAYAMVDLRCLGGYDWRLSTKNVWKVEQMLRDYPHRPLICSDRRYARLHARYQRFKAAHPDDKPLYYTRRDRWSPLPPEWQAAARRQAR